jgi:DNA mismatch repair protein MutS2
VIFPDNFEEKVGFDQIKRMLLDYCLSEMGEEFVLKMRFSNQFESIKKLLGQTEEFRQILLFGKPFPSQNYFNLTPELERIRIPGTYMLVYLDNLDSEKFPLIKNLTADLHLERRLLKRIEQIIDDRGNIRDDASENLREIRNRLIRLAVEIDKSIRQVFNMAKKNGWVNPNDEITLRNGRLVIPVPATHKRRIRGFIHDESATGQTVYIEPADALEANNEVKELENAERREIIKILTIFTDELRPEIDNLLEAYRFLGVVDFVRAKARLAIEIEAGLPTHS